MKIYYNHDEDRPTFYFMTWRDNGLFCFSLETPDMDTLQLCACSVGTREDEDKIFEEATQISELFNHQFNVICKKKHNYDGISRILQEVFNIDYKVIDRAYDRDLERAAFVKDVLSEVKNRYYSDSFYFSQLYDKARWYLSIWNGDKERAKRYMLEHDIPALHKMDGALVDVFGECHPTKRHLLYEFHDYWSDHLDKIIDEAVEKYQDKNDFDLAYYYTRDKLEETNYGYDRKTTD